MNSEFDEEMYKIVTGWKIPDINELKDRKLKFVFDNDEIDNIDKKYEKLHCKQNDVKFCLYDCENKKIVFTMEFFGKSGESRFSKFRDEPPCIKLELLNVNDYKMRKLGIASHYINKLQEYAIEKKFSFIKVCPCSDANNFKKQNKQGSLEQKKLEDFYMKRSTKEMPIKFSR